MSWTYSEEYYKNYTRETWDESAPVYNSLVRNLDQFNPAVFRHCGLRPGMRVLDIATGPGEPALTLGGIVGPAGRVVGVDLSERMVDIARDKAKRLALENVEFHTMDAESLAFPDGSFDLAVCRFGLQIVTDPNRAAREALRVLKSGGGFVATVWSTGDKVPAIDVIMAPMMAHAEPDENGYLPTPYEMGGSGELAALLQKEGFTETREERITLDWTFRDEEDFLYTVLKGTPIGHSLSEEDEAVQRDVLTKTRANLQRWKGPQGITLPAECVIVSATK